MPDQEEIVPAENPPDERGSAGTVPPEQITAAPGQSKLETLGTEDLDTFIIQSRDEVVGHMVRATAELMRNLVPALLEMKQREYADTERQRTDLFPDAPTWEKYLITRGLKPRTVRKWFEKYRKAQLALETKKTNLLDFEPDQPSQGRAVDKTADARTDAEIAQAEEETEGFTKVESHVSDEAELEYKHNGAAWLAKFVNAPPARREFVTMVDTDKELYTVLTKLLKIFTDANGLPRVEVKWVGPTDDLDGLTVDKVTTTVATLDLESDPEPAAEPVTPAPAAEVIAHAKHKGGRPLAPFFVKQNDDKEWVVVERANGEVVEIYGKGSKGQIEAERMAVVNNKVAADALRAAKAKLTKLAKTQFDDKGNFIGTPEEEVKA